MKPLHNVGAAGLPDILRNCSAVDTICWEDYGDREKLLAIFAGVLEYEDAGVVPPRLALPEICRCRKP
ncbi:hypothetical protein P3T22_000969 [Paraburkholderia sp. GAS348]